MEGREDRVGGGVGFASRISSKVRPQDPGGGGGGFSTDYCSPGRSCCRDWRSIRVDRRGFDSVDRGDRGSVCGKLASIPVDLDEKMLAEVECSAGVAECMDDFILPMLAGTVSPSDVTEQVADDTASLADAGILFPAVSAGILVPAVTVRILFLAGPVGPVGLGGTLSPSDPAGILFPAVPAGKLFPVAPDRNGTLSPTDPAGLLFPAVPAGMPFPVDSDSDGTLSPTGHAGVLLPAVLMEFPVLEDPVVVRLYADPTVIDTRSVVDMAVVEEVRPAVPDVVHGLLWWPWLGLMQCTLGMRVRWIVTLMMTRGILGMISRR